MELGKAYITVMPSMRGGAKQLTSELTDTTSAAGTQSGQGFAAGFGKTATKALKAGGVAALGMTFAKGFSRMTAIDEAKAKLVALGNSTQTVANIAQNANTAVKGTAYGMDAAMTAAAAATAAGIQPGKELTRYLSLMGDAAAVAGVDMNEMGSIFNKVAANGKVTTEEMNQLADRGIPIWQLLAKETGMSMDELHKAIEGGKIDVNAFQNAIESGMGGAAKTIGSTTITGAISNIGASISRIGANLLGTSDDANSFAGKLLPLMNKLMGFMGKIEVGASVLGQTISSILGPIMDGLGKVFTVLGNNMGTLAPLKTVLQQIGQVVGTVITAMIPVVVANLRSVFAVLGPILSILAKIISKLIPIITTAVKIGTTIMTVSAKITSAVTRTAANILSKLTFSGLVGKVRGVWNKVKTAITKPVETAKNKLQTLMKKIKNIFKAKPKLTIRIPKISLSGGKAPFGIGGKGSLPHFRIRWNAQGGIVDGATLIGAGEKGKEAIVPLDPFWRRLENSQQNIDYNALGMAVASALARTDFTTVLEVDSKAIARSTARAMNDEINKLQTRSNRQLGYV